MKATRLTIVMPNIGKRIKGSLHGGAGSPLSLNHRSEGSTMTVGTVCRNLIFAIGRRRQSDSAQTEKGDARQAIPFS